MKPECIKYVTCLLVLSFICGGIAMFILKESIVKELDVFYELPIKECEKRF